MRHEQVWNRHEGSDDQSTIRVVIRLYSVLSVVEL